MSSVALEDIWDAPATLSTPRRRHASVGNAQDSDDEQNALRPAKKLRSTLFLASDSEDEHSKEPRPPVQNRTEARPDIDAMFENLDDDDNFELAPALDINALRREAEAKHAKEAESQLHAIMPSSSPGREPEPEQDETGNRRAKGKKGDASGGKRKPLPKLDDERLLGPDGFPALIREAKDFKTRGKGHEISDLNRLIQLYQFWGHRMYPKTQFHDTVARVEKLCHSKRMHVALSVWRDEAKGHIIGHKPDDDAIDLTSDQEEQADEDDTRETKQRTRAASPTSDADASRHANPNIADDHDQYHEPVAQPPPSSPSSALDDADIDALIEEEAMNSAAASVAGVASEIQSVSKYASQGALVPPSDADEDEDDASMWDGMIAGVPDDEILSLTTSTSATTPSEALASVTNASSGDSSGKDHNAVDDDEIRAIQREMEEAQSKEVADAKSIATGTTGSGNRTNSADDDDDWDSMYL